ncbi:MAG: biosynthetic-type acetolactate synthase large subunit [Clostridium sp.]|uniref:biosynthetic-type acetolactate synthase large subunit n=1 Tax=Clostridium sp. TaxID=1506 RepID=UPI002914EAD2|nr:biosynthetic-type acetolactate synthase large subunit [Clostridium sp.]MDU7337961.1 biosynthetic-type acetolactate synthase large subunit [Clostridium sp.]
MLLTGAQIIMECLLEQDATTIFGYPGGAVLNIYDALYEYREKINHIETSHEQGAAHAADGFARASGKTGVCLATSGPGATNLVTGIATAYMDSVPMVAITGNVTIDLLGLDSFQEVDITGITMPITKHNFIVKDVSDLASTLREAFRIAESGRKGPVLVDIPKDVTAHKYEFTPLQLNQTHQATTLDESRFEQVLELLSQCERPYVYAGGGIISAEASNALHEFVELLDAPVSCSLMCQGGFDQTNERYLGMLGMHGTVPSAMALKECDVLFAVGTRFSDRVICNADLFARGCRVVHIDIDSAEFNKNINADFRLKGDARSILEKLVCELKPASHPEWMEQVKAWKQEYPLVQKSNCEGGVTPQYLLETLAELGGEDLILSTEVGQHQMWTAQYFPFQKPRRMITSGGLGTMGFGLGAALGAQVAKPELRVVNVAGDGSFHMNCAELSTAAKYNIPIIELIMNNNVLGMVRQWQKLFYDGRFSQTTLNKPTNYELLAEAFGVKAFTIRTCYDVESVLMQALEHKGPCLINCLINSDFNVLPMVPAGSGAEELILEIDEKEQQQ